jgi:hypothetical protein
VDALIALFGIEARSFSRKDRYQLADSKMDSFFKIMTNYPSQDQSYNEEEEGYLCREPPSFITLQPIRGYCRSPGLLTAAGGLAKR